MLDINLLREKPGLVKKNCKHRLYDENLVDEILGLDKLWRELKGEDDHLRAERNRVSIQVNEAKKSRKNPESLIERAKQINQKLAKNEHQERELRQKIDELLATLPNIIDESVPIGDASKNKEIFKFGKIPKFKFKIKDHADLLEGLDILDTKKASEIAGSRFYYLKNQLVKLNLAIINFALDFLKEKKFILIQPPFMIRRDVLSAALPLAAFEEMIYKIENEDLYLIGTAEHALNAYYINETIPQSKLPVRFAGISPCFRKEAGSHGKDTKGIFRTHQFEKIEQFVFCKPKDSWKEFDFLLNNSKEMLKQLGIPFRFVILSSLDMGRVATKTIDFEGWFPSQKGYRELGSCSNCLDYQARRGNIKFQDNTELKLVHTLNNTAIATERMIACIVENNQQKDGSIKIPKCLWKYAGFKSIEPAKAAKLSKQKIKKAKKK